jgi:hypothetical protein
MLLQLSIITATCSPHVAAAERHTSDVFAMQRRRFRSARASNDCSGRMQPCTASDPMNDSRPRSGVTCTCPQAFTFILCACCCAPHATLQPPTGTHKMRGHEHNDITRTHIAARQPTTPHYCRHLRPKNRHSPESSSSSSSSPRAPSLRFQSMASLNA